MLVQAVAVLTPFKAFVLDSLAAAAADWKGPADGVCATGRSEAASPRAGGRPMHQRAPRVVLMCG